MIVRTYGRRNRSGLGRTYSDSFNDIVSDHDSPTDVVSSQDFYNTGFPFSSQESTSIWPASSSVNPDPYSFNSSQDDPAPNGLVPRKHKKPRNGKLETPVDPASKTGYSRPFVPLTSTLMEAQEFGEMMEHVDEVNFALDGLRKGQPVRIRRASLLSLLSICGMVQRRRLLRTEGMSKTIIDAILGLSCDDSSSNLAAAVLFYVLTSDGQDDHLLESPSCIRFLIKLLKPTVSTASEDKAQNLGSKLLALRKDSDIVRDTSRIIDSSSSAIVTKVQEILVSCKDMKAYHGSNSGKRPELSPKWIALLTMEKACLSKISFEDTSGMVRKTGGNFKEKLRELGGLDAVFEVAVNCHSVMESWTQQGSHSSLDGKDDMHLQSLVLHLQSLVLLLKCLKIMENATFLSKDNQSHLLGMKGILDSHGHRLSFTKLIINVIKILSSLYLKSSSATISAGGPCSLSDRSNHASDLALTDGYRDCNEVKYISSSTNCRSVERSSNENFNISQKSTSPWSLSASCFETTTAFRNDNCQSKIRVNASASSSYSETLRSSSSGTPATSNGLRTKFSLVERPDSKKDSTYEPLEDSQDPYAFDEDDFQPSKWDLLSGKQILSKTRNGRLNSRELHDECQYQPMSQEETSNAEFCQQRLSNGDHKDSQKSSCSISGFEEDSSLLLDCLLTAVKVLMNLTNDNTVGCQQIAACGGLETMSSLIASHFPLFSSSLSFVNDMKEDNSSIELENQNDIHLTDQELDLLVAILGLLVNLVEKDGHNRSRLAAASVLLPSLEGLVEECRKDVIPLLCSIFLANQGAGDASGDANVVPWNDEAALLQGEREAEKMIVEAYSALLLAFLSTESKSIRDSIAECLPNHNLAILVPVLERFVGFHLTLNMISPETHKAVSEVIESCRLQ